MPRCRVRPVLLAFLLTACGSDAAMPRDEPEPEPNDEGEPANDEGEPANVERDASTRDAATRDARATTDAAPLDASSQGPEDAAEPTDPDDAAQEPADAGSDAGPPKLTPAYHVPLRVHRADSGLSSDALSNILNEVNDIWWSQAAICFAIEVVSSEEKRADGFDLWFHRSKLGCNTTANGVYCGDHDVHSLDMPSLGKADHAEWNVKLLPARTAAHELGHGLGLQHYNGFADSNDSLMSSGRQGFLLHDSEVTTARGRAPRKAATTSSSPCAKVAL